MSNDKRPTLELRPEQVPTTSEDGPTNIPPSIVDAILEIHQRTIRAEAERGTILFAVEGLRREVDERMTALEEEHKKLGSRVTRIEQHLGIDDHVEDAGA